jgi:hypothetical protein
MKSTADVTGGKSIAVRSQFISGAVNPLVAFYDINGRKGEVLFSVSDTTQGIQRYFFIRKV